MSMKAIIADGLKPCPFCGGKIKKFIAPLRGTTMFVCRKCGADVCFFGGEYEPEANEKWNRRDSLKQNDY